MIGTHVVVKKFGGPGGTEFVPGQVVDATAWPNTPALIQSRYLRARTVTEAAKDQPLARPARGRG